MIIVQGRLKWAIAAAAAVLIVAAAAYATNHLRTTHVLYLQSCAETPAFPGSDWMCRQALYRFHPTDDEVAEMNQKLGATWAIDMKDEAQARRLLQHYVAAGLDVNATDREHPQAAWTALHVAVTGADARGVRLLLEAGADPGIKDAKGRTPLDLAKEQAQRFPKEAAQYQEIEKLLEPAAAAQ